MWTHNDSHQPPVFLTGLNLFPSDAGLGLSVGHISTSRVAIPLDRGDRLTDRLLSDLEGKGNGGREDGEGEE